MNDPGSNSIVFTVCSANYLAQAKTLEQSLLKFNPACTFFVALVDLRSEEIDYSIFDESKIIELNEQIIPGYKDMISRYSIIEINTAIKPFFFQYLAATYPQSDSLFYFDPDIVLYDSLTYLQKLLHSSDILITPHFLTPVPVDGLQPTEAMALNYGVYNLGFLAVKTNSDQSALFLKWWGERTFNFGYFNTSEGLFVDQLWINLVPVYFKKVKVVTHFGCNMGPWNLYEREVSAIESDGLVSLANGEKLIFYHFSSFSYRNFYHFSEDYNRFSFSRSPLLKQLYQSYGESMIKNRVEYYSALSCKLPLITTHPPLKSRLVRPVLGLMKKIWKKI